MRTALRGRGWRRRALEEWLVPMGVPGRQTVVVGDAGNTAPPRSEAELGKRRPGLHSEAAGTGNTGVAVGPFAAAAVDIALVVAAAAQTAAGGEAVRGR